jgi:GWxTD domain-containing protein
MVKEMKCTISLICMLIIFASVPLQAEELRGGTVFYEIDVARFYASEEWTFLEIYFSIPREMLTHKKEENLYKASFEMGISLFQEDSLLSQKTIQNVDPITSLDEIKQGQRLFNAFSVYLKEGTYKLRSRVTDLQKMQGGWHEMELEITPFSATGLDLSDIQLSTNIYRDTTKSIFTKNGFRIIPNPGGLYGIELPILYYYNEIYNLSPLVMDKDSSYTVQITILDSKGNIVKEQPSKTKTRAGASIVEVGKVNVAGLSSDNYKLQLAITDHAAEKSDVKEKFFTVYRHADFIQKGGEKSSESGVTLTDEFAGLTEEELDSTFNLCHYISTGKEKRQYKKLDLKGKRTFMKDFWRQRDTDPLTEFNEYKQEFYQRINMANARFSGTFKKGWKTDMGLIYVKYGEPDEIERYPYSMDKKAYEIWYYYSIEGGVYFVFVDIRNMNEMQLVHSTARNEIQDDEWERWLE